MWVVAALWVRNGLKSRMRALTTSIWVVMEILIALGAIFFAIWPKTISIGASFVMAASLVLNAFIWYLTIAFISFGWRDSFYYASAAWVASNMLAVAGMKFDTAITRVMPNNAPVIISIMSFLCWWPRRWCLPSCWQRRPSKRRAAAPRGPLQRRTCAAYP